MADWLVALILFVTEGVVAWTIQQANWISPQPAMLVTLALAILAAVVVVKRRVRPAIAHPLALILGLGIVFFQVTSLFPEPGIVAKTNHLVKDIVSWWRTIEYGEPSPGMAHIALLFAFLTWTVGYISTWFALKRRNPWVAIVSGTVIILLSLNFQGSDKYRYFVVFILAALALLAVVHYIKQDSRVSEGGRNNIKRGWLYWGSLSLVIMVLAVFFSWHAPQLKIEKIQTFARDANPWREEIEHYWQSFFSPVPAKVPGLAHGGQNDLQFGGSLELSETPIFYAYTDHTHYWKTQIYDYYNTTGWVIGQTTEETVNSGASSPVPIASGNYSGLTYTVVPQINTNVVPSTGELVSGDFPIIKRDLSPLVFTIHLDDPGLDKGLPADIASLGVSLRAARYTINRYDRQITAMLPKGLTLSSVSRENNRVTAVTVKRDAMSEDDTVSLTSFGTMMSQKPYQVTVRVAPEYTPEQLGGAGTDYPAGIRDHYLQLPADFSPKVKKIAADVTQGFATPYGKALMIKLYLSKIDYSLIIQPPPPGADGVEYFLTEQKSGYCTYFASAMAVMLRSQGVPARLVVGFMPGERQEDSKRFLIRDKDYHAWTEVYFPGYGWVLFDPTPGPNQGILADGETTGAAGNPAELFYDPEFYAPPPMPGDSTTDVKSASYAGYIASGIIAVLALAVFLAWFLAYRRPGRNSAIYSRMVLLASMAGMGPKVAQTPLEFSGQLRRALPYYAPDIDNITSVYVEARYGRRAPEATVRNDLTVSWQRIRETLLRRVLRLV